jgi:transcriptional regulator GlxA family with amidase domain
VDPRNRGRTREGPRPEVRTAWQQLAHSHGPARIVELARKTARSSRQLSNLFSQELGIRSKILASLMRFDHVLAAFPVRTSAPGGVRT